MSHLDHPVKAPRVAILNFADCRQTEVHAVGCAHAAKATRVSECAEGHEPRPDDIYGDDWYHVAPCARKAPKEALR